MKLRLPRWEEVRRLPLTMMIASLLAALGIVQMSFLLGQSVYRTLTWTQQTSQALGQQAQLQQDVRVLQEAVSKASDPEYMNALARCIGYVGKNEQVVVAQSAQDESAHNQSEQNQSTQDQTIQDPPPGGNCDPVRLP